MRERRLERPEFWGFAQARAREKPGFPKLSGQIDAPVSVDFEGGYSDDNGALAENVAHLLELGIIGINFEDRVVQGADSDEVGRPFRLMSAGVAGRPVLDVISPIARRAGSSGGVFRRLLAQTVAAELEAVGIVNDAVEDGVSEGRLAEHNAMPQ